MNNTLTLLWNERRARLDNDWDWGIFPLLRLTTTHVYCFIYSIDYAILLFFPKTVFSTSSGDHTVRRITFPIQCKQHWHIRCAINIAAIHIIYRIIHERFVVFFILWLHHQRLMDLCNIRQDTGNKEIDLKWSNPERYTVKSISLYLKLHDIPWYTDRVQIQTDRFRCISFSNGLLHFDFLIASISSSLSKQMRYAVRNLRFFSNTHVKYIYNWLSVA